MTAEFLNRASPRSVKDVAASASRRSLNGVLDAYCSSLWEDEEVAVVDTVSCCQGSGHIVPKCLPLPSIECPLSLSP